MSTRPMYPKPCRWWRGYHQWSAWSERTFASTNPNGMGHYFQYRTCGRCAKCERRNL